MKVPKSENPSIGRSLCKVCTQDGFFHPDLLASDLLIENSPAATPRRKIEMYPIAPKIPSLFLLKKFSLGALKIYSEPPKFKKIWYKVNIPKALAVLPLGFETQAEAILMIAIVQKKFQWTPYSVTTSG